ncbi:hypothetical protein [Arenimonas daejeonensis]|uniref:hypothetical protein n=1 Tax=Arenimonas daejeonensis TaxID=370777 RepID=UPI001D14A56F|nr:hypothetical protein [Arenimonas daejeonensis]
MKPGSSGASRPGSMISMAPAMSGSDTTVDISSERSVTGARPTAVALPARVWPLTCTLSRVASRPREVCWVRLRTSVLAFSISTPRMAA